LGTMSGESLRRAMTCDELEGFLYVYLDGEFGASEKVEFERHLASCSSCARKVHVESAFRENLRRLARESANAPSARAPESLRRSIQSWVRQEQQRAAFRGWVRASAAAAVIVAAGGAYFYLRPGSRAVYIEAAALRHAKSLPFEVQRDAPELLEAWFKGKLEHSVRVPTFPNTTVAGARLSNVKDKQAAYIAYDAASVNSGRTTRIGLFVFQDSDRDVPAQPLSSVELDSSHGYNVAIWRDREIVYELVSDLDESDIRQMLAQSALPRRRSLVNEQRPAPTTPAPTVQTPSLVQPASLQQ